MIKPLGLDMSMRERSKHCITLRMACSACQTPWKDCTWSSNAVQVAGSLLLQAVGKCRTRYTKVVHLCEEHASSMGMRGVL
jgi:hypothetical protein